MMCCSGLVLPPSTRKGSGRLLVPGKRQPKILCSARMPEWQELARAIHDRQPVAGLTHNFYKYPARFSPSFVRQAILNFTEPGDLVLDPFMGAGTSLVEARVLGRKAIGTDLNTLAVFLAEAKTRALSGTQLRRVASWGRRLAPKLSLHRSVSRTPQYWSELGYHRNINGRKTWRIRKLLELSLSRLSELPTETERNFARCVLLRTGQWALDCREDIPAVEEIRQQRPQRTVEEFCRDRVRLDQGRVNHDSPLRRGSVLRGSSQSRKLFLDEWYSSFPKKGRRKLLWSVRHARMQIHALGSLHLRDIISIHSPAAEAHLTILSLRATVWPRKTMATKPLRNLLESCEHTGPRAKRQEIFSARGGLGLKQTLHASFLHIRHSAARSVILVTRSSDAANSDNCSKPLNER